MFQIDGLQYCNWSRHIFEQMREGRMDAVHVTICYHETFRETAGNIATWLWPRHGYHIWIAVNVVGVLATLATIYFRVSARSFDVRMLVAYLLFFAFGYLCTKVLGDFTPRQLGTFWPIYFMLLYAIAGLWLGYAFVLIGVGISILTLIGYFYVGGETFSLWMAFVNGGGLLLGGLWMRRT